MRRTPSAAQRVYEIAAEQYGYFSAQQARVAGVDPRTVVMMARRGAVERVRRGVYRLSRFPESEMGQYMEAILWPHGARGVISHDSALALYELSDVNPTAVHITLPRFYRVRRAIPGFLTVHHADLEPNQIATFEGLPLTTPERTIRDCAGTSLGAALVRQAIHDGSRLGHLTGSKPQRSSWSCSVPRGTAKHCDSSSASKICGGADETRTCLRQ